MYGFLEPFYVFIVQDFYKRHIIEFFTKSLSRVILSQTQLYVARLVRLRAFSTHSVNV